MKIVNTGIKYQIYDDSLRTFDSLPAATYCVRFSKLSGFYLESRPNMQVNETVYGPHESKVEKVIASYNAFPRSLGVILSGAKGIGKSMFARLLSTRAISAGLPVLIVDEAIPGIASYLESIDQEVMILFDEFDKTFAHPSDNDKTDPQSTMLSLFDGTSNGKRLFVVTCNDLKGLNDFLVNRPGRFHYHFRFDYPTADEIRTYMQDKLKPEYYDQIDAVIGFAGRVDLNYDCLRSIAFELNTGLPFTEAIKDLNIVNLNAEHYNITMKFANGIVYTASNVRRDLFDPSSEEYVRFFNKNGDFIFEVTYNNDSVQFDKTSGTPFVEGKDLTFEYRHISDDELSDPDEKACYDAITQIKSTTPAALVFRRHDRRVLHKANMSRVYTLNGKTVATNRHKAIKQTTDSLEEFRQSHPGDVCKLKVKEHHPAYRNLNRNYPGSVFLVDGQVHVMQGVSGSHNGKADGYYNTNGNAYPYYKCKFVVKNEGIVFA